MRPNKRDELVRKALSIYYRDGFHATGMDKLAAEACVSKTAIYKHFRTKEDLILAALRLRDESFRNWFRRRIEELSSTPEGQLLASFDALAEWLSEDNYRGCMFIKAGAEFQEADHPIHVQASEHKRLLLDYMSKLAKEAGFADPDQVALHMTLLQEGAIVTGVLLKKTNPAEHAKIAAKTLLNHAARIA